MDGEPTALLPCPFCGGDEIDAREDGSPFPIRCVNCGAEIPYSSLDCPQSQRWNTRSAPPVDQGRVAKALEATASALHAFNCRVFQRRDGGYYWGSDPSHDEVQAALAANNEARAALTNKDTA